MYGWHDITCGNVYDEFVQLFVGFEMTFGMFED